MTLDIPPEHEREAASRPSSKQLLGATVFVILLLGMAAAAFYYFLATPGGTPQSTTGDPSSSTAPSVEPNPPSPEGGLHELKKTSESFRFIAKKVGPAVVNIQSTKGKRNPLPRGNRRGKRQTPEPPVEEEDEEGSLDGDPLWEYFQRFGMPFPYNGAPPDLPQTSLGSGIIVDPTGIVVTNNHVVEDASEIIVSLSSEKTELKAKIIGTDSRSDLAVLRIEKPGTYPTAQWADSDAVEVGDWAVAIGSPFALGQSVTVGIVSAKGRSAQGITGADFAGDLIQTDAAINPGNSGGPLCDLDGRIMGVNTAIYTRTGGYMGIGFAIPSNLAKDVVGHLIKEGKIVRGWMGVYIQPVDEDLGAELGILDKKTGLIAGVSIHEVVPDSPAEKAGLKAGDVIVEVDGKPVKDPSKLQQAIGSFKPGQSVDLKVLSYVSKKRKTVRVKIGTLPDKEKPSKRNASEKPDKLGLTVGETKEGLRVDTIQPGSPAEQILGLETGDVILSINREKVATIEKYRKLIQSRKLSMEVKRGNRTLFFRLTLPE